MTPHTNIDYDEMFPHLHLRLLSQAEDTCRFYFSSNPTECLNYVRNKVKNQIENIDFAYEKCKSTPTQKCCKLNAQDNDVAYQYCMNHISNTPSYWFLLFLIPFVLLFLYFLIQRIQQL